MANKLKQNILETRIIDIANLNESLWNSFYSFYLRSRSKGNTNILEKPVFIERYVSTIQNDSINYEVVLNGPKVIGLVEKQFLSSGNKEKIVALDLSLSSFELFEVIENYFSSYVKVLIEEKLSVRIETRERKFIKFLKQFNFSVTNKVKYFKLQI